MISILFHLCDKDNIAIFLAIVNHRFQAFQFFLLGGCQGRAVQLFYLAVKLAPEDIRQKIAIAIKTHTGVHF